MTATTDPDFKELLHHRLKQNREVLWHKAAGLPEWQQRMPLTPSGTNLLGLVKHVALVEADYFGALWGNPVPGLPEYVLTWDENSDLEDDDDLWAFEDESPAEIFAMAATVAGHADALIQNHGLSEAITVPWWGPDGGRRATLGELLVHMLNEVARHVGHADLARELTDGQIGLREGVSNLPEGRTEQGWLDGHDKLLAVAEATKPHDADQVR
ncbi:DinB family protein [Galactobacter sp.]|uniref:DinB family protein n=1 Tax=Galactobacter sp. TaxID=2676125 RepID=UPI0025BFF827|nr:DinB family protein [Galactobacter sp.]